MCTQKPEYFSDKSDRERQIASTLTQTLKDTASKKKGTDRYRARVGGCQVGGGVRIKATAMGEGGQEPPLPGGETGEAGAVADGR